MEKALEILTIIWEINVVFWFVWVASILILSVKFIVSCIIESKKEGVEVIPIIKKRSREGSKIKVVLKVIALAIFIFLLLLVIASPPWARRGPAPNTVIRHHLSRIRSNAEQWYHDEEGGDGSYKNYDISPGWKILRNEIPDCSQQILRNNPDAYGINVVSGEERLQYQLTIKDTENYQEYAAWAPLCPIENSERFDEGVVYYCVDSERNADEFINPINTKKSNCEDIFEKREE